jgi:hypothetical protein
MDIETPTQWIEDDLARMGGKLAEFSTDAFQPAGVKRDLLEAVSSAVRRVEHQHEICIT